jgi:hypothetical protein
MGGMTLKRLLVNRLEQLEKEAQEVCGDDKGAYYVFYEWEINDLKREIEKLNRGSYMIHLNDLEREIYQLERELLTAIMNDRDWDIDRLKNEIKDLKNELEKSYWD